MIPIRNRDQLKAYLADRRMKFIATANGERSADRFNYSQGCADTFKEVLDLIRAWEDSDGALKTDGRQ